MRGFHENREEAVAGEGFAPIRRVALGKAIAKFLKGEVDVRAGFSSRSGAPGRMNPSLRPDPRQRVSRSRSFLFLAGRVHPAEWLRAR